ncbi:hypothetical protein VKT23_013870 [Stygiomarasmius scandens]|uniref:DUF6532 domain-containing protein n=1 Tax=Marasmiellus scandens TaxID=2682957 RepID=A0ABR1J6S5_9AGAR
MDSYEDDDMDGDEVENEGHIVAMEDDCLVESDTGMDDEETDTMSAGWEEGDRMIAHDMTKEKKSQDHQASDRVCKIPGKVCQREFKDRKVLMLADFGKLVVRLSTFTLNAFPENGFACWQYLMSAIEDSEVDPTLKDVLKGLDNETHQLITYGASDARYTLKVASKPLTLSHFGLVQNNVTLMNDSEYDSNKENELVHWLKSEKKFHHADLDWKDKKKTEPMTEMLPTKILS